MKFKRAANLVFKIVLFVAALCIVAAMIIATKEFTKGPRERQSVRRADMKAHDAYPARFEVPLELSYSGYSSTVIAKLKYKGMNRTAYQVNFHPGDDFVLELSDKEVPGGTIHFLDKDGFLIRAHDVTLTKIVGPGLAAGQYIGASGAGDLELTAEEYVQIEGMKFSTRMAILVKRKQ